MSKEIYNRTVDSERATDGLKQRLLQRPDISFGKIKVRIDRLKKPLPRYVAAVACLVLGLAIGIFVLINNSNNKERFPALNVIIYNNAYYTPIIRDDKVLEMHNLPVKITKNMVGEYLGYFESDNKNPPFESKDIKLYKYNAIDVPAVILAEDHNGEYYFALFGNHILSDGDDHVEISSICETFGIRNEKDIISFGLSDSRRNKDIHYISDRNSINNFYNAYCSLVGISNDEFNARVFNDMDEAERQALATSLADENQGLYIKLNNGLIIPMNYYPSIGLIYYDMSYYEVTENLSALFKM